MRLSTALEGRYRIDGELGQGGMATVYLAHDLKHDRKVALKVLRPELSAILGGERFLAEIKTTANLQHPHILGLFDSGEADGLVYYVMPFVDGESLRDRLVREKQLPVEEAVRLAREVADALHYAHERGVIHRDIKPENILLHEGQALVADFGIALAVSTAGGGTRMTETGMSLGTPHYMAPEQAMGEREITPKADIYAMGCVLYEMLTAEPPFVGATMQAIVARVMVEEPRSLAAQRRAIPANVEAAVRSALEKLPADRFVTAKAFADALANPAFRHNVQATDSAARTAVAPLWKPLALGLAAVTALLLGVVMLRGAGNVAPAIPTTLDLDVSELDEVNAFAVSRDGRMFVVSAQAAGGVRQLWIRTLGEAEFRPIPGTEQGIGPDFSPDGRWIVFVHPARNALLKVALAGGGALPVMEVDTVRTGSRPSWGTDETITFANPRGVWRVASSGLSPPVQISRFVRGLIFARTQLLPDGSAVLYDDPRGIHLIDLANDSAHLIVPEAQWPNYLATGHLLYESRSGGLFVVPFDARRHEVTGPPVPVLDGVAPRSFAVSTNGTMVYMRGTAAVQATSSHLVFLDRTGKPDTVRLAPRKFRSPRISPDGRAVAFTSESGRLGRTFAIQVHDFLDGSTKVLTSEGLNDAPVWSPDGKRIAFTSNQQDSEDVDIFGVPVDGSAPPQRVTGGPGPQIPLDWVANDVIAFRDGVANADIKLLQLGPGGGVTSYAEGENSELEIAVSPDGAFAAYMEMAGGLAVYVREFPVPRGKWRIAAGCCPRWSPDGRELYVWAPRDSAGSPLLAIPVQGAPRFAHGEPRRLFAGNYDVFGVGWDVHLDGRFLVTQAVGTPAARDVSRRTQSRYVVVLNWFEELKGKLSATVEEKR